ncbi:DMT family transporter [Sporolactobacillus laevolacticus]|uniref:DMT family transporter n=1 Tax=Sporolactobacillus laevolacticus TaxID=33018 RepID=UPI0025B38DC4|nr:DMT family transporter [Sporolactobacillus laevolacticus]MDN3954489.1 DMT family transporter [Sporolactobacillus laevolacticus]
MRKSVIMSPYLLLTVGVLSVSFSAIFVKWSTAPASIIAMYRMLLTVLMLLPIGAWRYVIHGKLNKSDWIRLMLSGVFLAMHFLFWMESLKLTSVASSTVILTLQPAFTMIGMLLFYRSKTSGARITSLVIAILGSLIIAWGDIDLSGQALLGDVLSMLGAGAYAIHLLFGQQLMKKMSGESYSFIVFFIAGLCLLVFNVFTNVEMYHYSFNNWLVFILLALVSTVLGHMLFNISLKYVDATMISMSVVAEPVIASVLALILLHESIVMVQFVGGIITLLGVALYFFNPKKGIKLRGLR